MRKSKRAILALLLVFGIILLSGCGIFSFSEVDTKKEETTVPEETEPFEELPVVEESFGGEIKYFLNDLSGNNYGGAAARIVTAKKDLIIPDDNTGTVISQKAVERNKAVEDALGISVSAEERDADTMLQELKAAVRSGDYYADAVMFPQDMIGAYVTGDAIINMKSLPGFKTDAKYYYQSAVAAGTGGEAIYAVAGPASLNADGLSCIYFNKAIIEAAGLESPYDLADRGEWTIDKYLEYMNSAEGLSEEYYGYGAQNTSTYLTDLLFFGCGETFTKSTFGYYPALTLGSEKTGAVIDKIKSVTVNGPKTVSALTAIDTFNGGKMLFLVDRLDTMKTLANSKTDWGILPIPKYDSAQEKYLTLANYEDAMFFGAVSTAPNYEMSADVIECMNIYSYGEMRSAYVKNAMYYYLRDNASVRMLDTIVREPVFDFAYSFASTYNAIPSATFMAVRNTVSGVSSLERYLNMWQRQFESSMYYLFDVQE